MLFTWNRLVHVQVLYELIQFHCCWSRDHQVEIYEVLQGIKDACTHSRPTPLHAAQLLLSRRTEQGIYCYRWLACLLQYIN